ncbi:hypothetical protein R5R35_007548 [Gryllus longicercus]|uniref:Cilia- and flagella-associated protein 157 n=1 Tax=Gryllus longicercus TaxID=2509291 RepID=A0AAN9ZC33_9ORTH
MAKKGKGKKGKKGKKEPTEGITEVERELFTIQIADLTAKVERLKARCLELEASNVEFEENIKHLDEDRGDVITYLRTQADQKQDEIEELEERVEGLIRARENDVSMYKEIIRQSEHDFKIMHEQLTSEIKLLTGKLNSLEDFRLQRDDLVKKFKLQEEQMGVQDEKHKQIIYEVEKKFIIAKDKLKKEMEGKLLQLSSNFSDATEIRIAATTHHAIRENIAINNELDRIIATHNKLMAENEKIKNYDKELRQKFELVEEEKRILLRKNSVLLKLLNRLAREHQDMEVFLGELEREAQVSELCQLKLEEAERALKQAQLETRFETQKVHGALYEQQELKMLADEAKLRGDKLNAVVEQCVSAIQEVITVTEGQDETSMLQARETLLSRLLTLMDSSTLQYITVPPPKEKKSMYETGDLGLVPKTSFTSISRSGSGSVTSVKQKSSSISFKSKSGDSKSSRASQKESDESQKTGTSQDRPSGENVPNRTSLRIRESSRPSGELQMSGGRKSTRKSGLDDVIKEEGEAKVEFVEPKQTEDEEV